ncbi:MAG: hypothetical protein JXA04_10665 [Gammaproteobacteria bacterium]|nr:hypothetical protein [Gammaproteobacteria bacterium]
MKDLHSNIKSVQHVPAAAVTATVTPAAAVDLSGFNSVEFLIAIGTITNIANSPAPSWAFHLEESDSASTGFTAVTNSDDVLTGSAASPVTTPDGTTGVFLTVNDADDDAATYRIGYVGNKQYVRVISTASDTPGSTPLYICAVLGNPALSPTAD